MTYLNEFRSLPTDKGFYRKIIFSIYKLVGPRLSRNVNSVWRKAGNTNEQLKVGNALGTTGRWIGQPLRGLH
jgi:hypothetical protein